MLLGDVRKVFNEELIVVNYKFETQMKYRSIPTTVY